MKIRFNQAETQTNATGGGAASTTAAPASAPSAAPQTQQQWAPPIGHRVVPDDVYTRFSELEKKAAGLGNLDEYGQLAGVLKERGMTPSQLAQLFSVKKPEKAENAAFDAEKFKSELLGEVSKQTTRERAEAAYREKIAELPKTIRAKVKALLGDDFDDSMAELIADGFESRVHRSRFSIDRPEGDPLRGQYGSDWNEAMIEEAMKPYADLPSKLKGQQLKAVGEAVNKARAASAGATPAGNPGGNGAPTQDDSKKLFHQKSDVEQQDYIRKLGAKRGLNLA